MIGAWISRLQGHNKLHQDLLLADVVMMHDQAISLVGWRELVALPSLGIPELVAKVDTGARTSSLDARVLSVADGWVRFAVPLWRDRSHPAVEVEAPLVDWRWVRDSGGHGTLRPVIRTRVALGDWMGELDVTLAHRGGMQHRMLLGRSAVRGRFVVDAGRAFLAGAPRRVDAGVPDWSVAVPAAAIDAESAA